MKTSFEGYYLAYNPIHHIMSLPCSQSAHGPPLPLTETKACHWGPQGSVRSGPESSSHPHPPSLTPSPSSSSESPSWLLPQGLCAGCALYLECPFLV